MQKKILAGIALGLALCACSGPMDESIFTRLNADQTAKLSREQVFFVERTEAIVRDVPSQFHLLYQPITYRSLYDFETKYYDNAGFQQQTKARARADFQKEYDRLYRAELDQEKRKWGEFVRDNDPGQYLCIEAVTGIKEVGDASYPQFYFKVSEPKGAVKSAEIYYDAVRKGAKTSEDWADASLEEIKRVNSLKNSYYWADFDDPEYWSKHTMLIEVRKVVMEDGRVFSLSELSHVPASVRLYFQNPSAETEAGIIRETINPSFRSEEEVVEACYQDALKQKDPLCYDFLKNYGAGR